MISVDTTSHTHIDRVPDEVFYFVTNPNNWVGTHPVTESVAGVTAETGIVGSRWTESVRAPGAEAIKVEWIVTEAEPGKVWTIETDRLASDDVRCAITYTFEADADGTNFTRHMITAYEDDRPEYVAMAALSAKPDLHDEYLRKVKASLEKE
jgi:hypothetical protein